MGLHTFTLLSVIKLPPSEQYKLFRGLTLSCTCYKQSINCGYYLKGVLIQTDQINQFFSHKIEYISIYCSAMMNLMQRKYHHQTLLIKSIQWFLHPNSIFLRSLGSKVKLRQPLTSLEKQGLLCSYHVCDNTRNINFPAFSSVIVVTKYIVL